jgi:hypothetical protein
MRRYLIAVIIISVLVSGLLPGCTPTEFAKAPEDVIPLELSDFTLVEKKEHIRTEGAQYSASSLFIPKEGVKFQNKVAEVQITVFLFKDETTATSLFERYWTQHATKIKVKGVDTFLTYNEYGNRFFGNVPCGAINANQLRGRLIINSSSIAPLDFERLARDAPIPNFDKEALKEAAIQGLEATRL